MTMVSLSATSGETLLSPQAAPVPIMPSPMASNDIVSSRRALKMKSPDVFKQQTAGSGIGPNTDKDNQIGLRIKNNRRSATKLYGAGLQSVPQQPLEDPLKDAAMEFEPPMLPAKRKRSREENVRPAKHSRSSSDSQPSAPGNDVRIAIGASDPRLIASIIAGLDLAGPKAQEELSHRPPPYPIATSAATDQATPQWDTDPKWPPWQGFKHVPLERPAMSPLLTPITTPSSSPGYPLGRPGAEAAVLPTETDAAHNAATSFPDEQMSSSNQTTDIEEITTPEGAQQPMQYPLNSSALAINVNTVGHATIVEDPKERLNSIATPSKDAMIADDILTPVSVETSSFSAPYPLLSSVGERDESAAITPKTTRDVSGDSDALLKSQFAEKIDELEARLQSGPDDSHMFDPDTTSGDDAAALSDHISPHEEPLEVTGSTLIETSSVQNPTKDERTVGNSTTKTFLTAKPTSEVCEAGNTTMDNSVAETLNTNGLTLSSQALPDTSADINHTLRIQQTNEDLPSHELQVNTDSDAYLPPSNAIPIPVSREDQRFIDQVKSKLKIQSQWKTANIGKRQAGRIVSLLEIAQPPNTSEALFLSGEEAAKQVEPNVHFPGPIITSDQQTLPLQTPEQFLNEYYDNTAKVWIQDPAMKLSRDTPPTRAVTVEKLKERFLHPETKTRIPWNCLELATHVEDGLRPAFLNNEDCRLLTKLKHPGAADQVSRRGYDPGWKEVEKWALLAQGGSLTEPHQDSHGYGTYITVNTGTIGFGWLSNPTASERRAWRAGPETYVGGRWRYVVLRPGQTVFFPSGTVHFVFRLQSLGDTLAFGGHVLRCSQIVRWIETILEEQAGSNITNEELTVSAAEYLKRTEKFVRQALLTGQVEKWGGKEAIERFLLLKEEFMKNS